MKKWKVEGRLRVDYWFTDVVDASTEKSAINKAEKRAFSHLGIKPIDVIDDEIYCEEMK